MSDEFDECGCAKFGQCQFIYWCPCIKDDALAMVKCSLLRSQYRKVINAYEAGLLNEMSATQYEEIKHLYDEAASLSAALDEMDVSKDL